MWWCSSSKLVLLLLLLLMMLLRIHRMVPWHDILVMAAAHLVLMVVAAMSLVVVVVTIRTLEIASVVLIPLLHLEVATSALNVVLVHHLAIALGMVLRGVKRV